jgi:NADH:ubiquinone oxidoreductase subunit E
MLEVKVCVGTSCSFGGGLEILEYLEQDEGLEDKIHLTTSKCFNKACKPNNSPIVQVGDEFVTNATLDKVLLKIGEKLK